MRREPDPVPRREIGAREDAEPLHLRGGDRADAVEAADRQRLDEGGALAGRDGVWLAKHFGNSAEWLYNLARGIDHRRVKSNRPLKSLGGERTFFNDLITDNEIRSEEHTSEL